MTTILGIIAFVLIVVSTLIRAFSSKDPGEKRKASIEIIVSVLMVIGFVVYMLFQLSNMQHIG